MRTANSVKLVFVLLLVCICSCQKDDKGSNNPSEEWYEIQIANGTWQYEKISDLSALYKSYSFNENHSFVQYTKSAKRTKTTGSNGDVSYSKWEVATNETRRGTWKMIMNDIPALLLNYDDGREKRISVLNISVLSGFDFDHSGNIYKKEFTPEYIGPTF